MTINRLAVSRFTCFVLVGLLVLGAGMLAGCQGSGDSAAGALDSPRSGGTLRLAGAGDIAGLDPAAASTAPVRMLQRALTRQLVGYPATGPDQDAKAEGGTDGSADGGRDQPSAPVPDLAESLPEPTADRTTYTFRIRAGASWDTTPPRQVAAADVVRGFQRLCNPVATGGMPDYLPGLIAGMSSYCAGFARVSADTEAIRRYIATQQISGVQALDERTVRFVLTRPAADFLEILAMPFASPMPRESLDLPPDAPGFRQRFVSSGPYSIVRYAPGQGLVLERNPAWRPEADPVRRAYVGRIEIVLGVDAAEVQRRIETGAADLAWDTDVPAAQAARLAKRKDPQLSVTSFTDAGTAGPYLAMNLVAANENRAMANLRVRQALNHAVDKHAIAEALAGSRRSEPHDQVLPPGALGYEQLNLYPSPDHRGDPRTARQLLTDAGYPQGLTLTLAHPATPNGARIAAVLKGGLAEAGVRLLLSPRPEIARPVPGEPGATDWDLRLVDPAPSASGGAPGAGSAPGTAGRAIFAAMFAAGVADPGVRERVERALAAPSREEAARHWAQADRQAMQAALRVPLVTARTAQYRAARVKGWAVTPVFPRGDLTSIWLARQ